MVTHLENRSERAHQLVEERGPGLHAWAFSRAFSHLQNTDPLFDFDAAIGPVPEAIRGNLARWVEDNVDALVRAFTYDDNGEVVVADEGDVVNDGEDGANDGDGEANDSDSDSSTSDASGGDQEDVVSDMSD